LAEARPTATPSSTRAITSTASARRRRAQSRTDDEDDRRGDDRATAPKPVSRLSGNGGAEDRADRHRADDHPLLEAAEIEVALDEEQRAGDDPRVVAEEQPAEARDRRRGDDVAVGALFVRRHGPFRHLLEPRVMPVSGAIRWAIL
jgi:hypothetical protein